MPKHDTGAGSLLIRSINGAGLLVLLGAVTFGGIEWARIKDHCAVQAEKERKQEAIDQQQDQTLKMMNDALIRIDVNVQRMQKDIELLLDSL